VDPHKQSHTAVAADELGRDTVRRTVRTRREGYRELTACARLACLVSAAGRWRTSGMWPAGWSGSCWGPGRHVRPD